MIYFYTTCFFIFGIVLGSFYNVVGYRLPRGESLIKPGSHCPNCGHYLTPIELIPIASFLIQKGKCRKCNTKISWFYTIFEFLTGILFALSFLKFGFSIDLIITLLFVSMAIIIIISDYQTLTIPDEILIFFSLALIILSYFDGGIDNLIDCIINGILSFITMYAIKIFGDFIFKKESMGGGDIKLMFIFGIVIGYYMSIFSIFLASLIGLPVSLFFLLIKKTNIIPFGPFLCISAMIILFFQIDVNFLLNILMF